MLNTVYRLVSPGQIEAVLVEENITNDAVVICPTHLSICNADQRYYNGSRDEKILKKKLPMSLIHEGVGVIVKDFSNTFKEGDKVIVVPNIPKEVSETVAENYLSTSKFRSSGFDGLMQEYVFSTPDRLIKVPDGIKDEVASIIELLSVVVHSVDKLEKIRNKDTESFGVWGDGSLGYLMANVLFYTYPESKIYVFGKNEDKLNFFSFVTETFTIDSVPKDLELSHCFECVGGAGSERAIDQIIDKIKPQGTVAILGVSEEKVAINTRIILEKGITISGTSRSKFSDFIKAIEYLNKHEKLKKRIELLISNRIDINNIHDIHIAFGRDLNIRWGKTIMNWKI
jgi:ribitol-5-phosphate 2-dehydrogenase